MVLMVSTNCGGGEGGGGDAEAVALGSVQNQCTSINPLFYCRVESSALHYPLRVKTSKVDTQHLPTAARFRTNVGFFSNQNYFFRQLLKCQSES